MTSRRALIGGTSKQPAVGRAPAVVRRPAGGTSKQPAVGRAPAGIRRIRRTDSHFDSASSESEYRRRLNSPNVKITTRRIAGSSQLAEEQEHRRGGAI